MYMISLQNYAGIAQESYEIIIMKLFATLDKKKCKTLTIISLHQAAVKFTTIEMCNYHYNTAQVT